ncbi:MAG TPA: phosphoribosyltransferase [Streptosporangiaceae bacterium]|nr:phosphoribosyltransferase [Streptosporangiaceae bacterium]
MRFRDRADAGRRLAQRLSHLRGEDVVVLGLPRGGVAVAAEVARELYAPLDVILVRKLGVPAQPELGRGAIGEDGTRIINSEVIRYARVSEQELARVEQRERSELRRRADRYRGDRTRLPLAGRTAVIVDDGIATGSTARAACHVARAQGAERVVLAVPVAPRAAATMFDGDADEVVCLVMPERFLAIGEWYEDFTQTSDEEVVRALRPRAGPAGPAEEVTVAAGEVLLSGQLTPPAPGAGLVVFAHGSGSSRHSPRNAFVAGAMHEAGLGTLMFDLLTGGEEGNRSHVFDIGLLAGRLNAATHWLRDSPVAKDARVGYFGASTGAAAALCAAAEPDSDISAVVSRGGRPDLAGTRALGRVQAPVLLIVGGRDEMVLGLNRAAQTGLRGDSRLVVVPGATHLFEEAGALGRVADLACDWFTRFLSPQPLGPG